MAASGPEDQHLIKVAYLYNFAKFTTWPEGAINDQLNLCVLGEDDLGETLGQLKGKTVKGRPIVVQALPGSRVPKHCHVLYVAASESQRLEGIFKEVRDRPVLTVGEQAKFAELGGIIELERQYARTRFVINLGVARGAGLEINPSLLALAEVIGP